MSRLNIASAALKELIMSGGSQASKKVFNLVNETLNDLDQLRCEVVSKRTLPPYIELESDPDE